MAGEETDIGVLKPKPSLKIHVFNGVRYYHKVRWINMKLLLISQGILAAILTSLRQTYGATQILLLWTGITVIQN